MYPVETSCSFRWPALPPAWSRLPRPDLAPPIVGHDFLSPTSGRHDHPHALFVHRPNKPQSDRSQPERLPPPPSHHFVRENPSSAERAHGPFSVDHGKPPSTRAPIAAASPSQVAPLTAPSLPRRLSCKPTCSA